MWIVVGAVIGGLILLGILLICIPVGLVWDLEYYDRFKSNIRWTWLWGLVSGNVRARKRPRKKRKRGFSLKRALRNVRTALDLTNKDLFTHIIRFLIRIIRRIHFRKLKAELQVGLGDPAETFYLFLLTEPANRLLSSLQPYPVNIRLDFNEPTIEGYFLGEARVYPIQMVPPVLQLVFSITVFRVMKKLVSTKWKRNS